MKRVRGGNHRPVRNLIQFRSADQPHFFYFELDSTGRIGIYKNVINFRMSLISFMWDVWCSMGSVSKMVPNLVP